MTRCTMFTIMCRSTRNNHNDSSYILAKQSVNSFNANKHFRGSFHNNNNVIRETRNISVASTYLLQHEYKAHKEIESRRAWRRTVAKNNKGDSAAPFVLLAKCSFIFCDKPRPGSRAVPQTSLVASTQNKDHRAHANL